MLRFFFLFLTKMSQTYWRDFHALFLRHWWWPEEKFLSPWRSLGLRSGITMGFTVRKRQETETTALSLLHILEDVQYCRCTVFSFTNTSSKWKRRKHCLQSHSLFFSFGIFKLDITTGCGSASCRAKEAPYCSCGIMSIYSITAWSDCFCNTVNNSLQLFYFLGKTTAQSTLP